MARVEPQDLQRGFQRCCPRPGKSGADDLEDIAGFVPIDFRNFVLGQVGRECFSESALGHDSEDCKFLYVFLYVRGKMAIARTLW